MTFRDLFRRKWQDSDDLIRARTILKLEDRAVLLRLAKVDASNYVLFDAFNASVIGKSFWDEKPGELEAASL